MWAFTGTEIGDLEWRLTACLMAVILRYSLI